MGVRYVLKQLQPIKLKTLFCESVLSRLAAGSQLLINVTIKECQCLLSAYFACVVIILWQRYSIFIYI